MKGYEVFLSISSTLLVVWTTNRSEKMKKGKTVLLIGSGPIQIGQAAEFDYSGAQACRALAEEGVRVVLVNSNPATIMTDPEMADKVYIEPITAEIIEEIIRKERPEGVIAGLGGQTGLNVTAELAEKGVLEKYNVEPPEPNSRSFIERQFLVSNQYKKLVVKRGIVSPSPFIMLLL